MSTESQTPPTPAAPTATPGETIRAVWGRFKRGELIPYRIMAVLLIVAVVVGFIIFMQLQRSIGESKMWVDLEGATTPQELEKIITDHPNTMPARLAEVHLARINLAQDGIDKLVTGDQAQRQKALEKVESAKQTFAKLAPELKDSPVLQAECYLGLAKAELALIGITKEGRIDTFRGSPAAAAESLDKLAEVADGTPWGEMAKKNAADLRAAGGSLPQEIVRVQTTLYNMSFFPTRPGGFGGMPFGGPMGGMPPGFPPMGGPGGGIPGLPGMPGGGMPLPPGHP
jgi:hypothetical protein